MPISRAKRKKALFLSSIAILLSFYGSICFFSLATPLPSEKKPVILYANKCRDDFRLTLKHAIQKAKNSLFLSMYSISDPSLTPLLRKKSNTLRKTQIFYDRRNFSPLKGENIHPVKISGLMHQKICLIDEKQVFIGSTNLTPTSLLMDENINIGLYSPKLAKFLQSNVPFGRGHFETTIGSQKIEFWLLPDRKKEALERICQLIRSAEKKIHLSMFTLTHPILINELIEAKKRGVFVQVMLDSRNKKGPTSHLIKPLFTEKVALFFHSGRSLFHYKYLLIDENILLLGSANWTKAAFHKNRDCFLILFDLTEEQKKVMQKIEKGSSLQMKSENL